jgi:hypothetical protein
MRVLLMGDIVGRFSGEEWEKLFGAVMSRLLHISVV